MHRLKLLLFLKCTHAKRNAHPFKIKEILFQGFSCLDQHRLVSYVRVFFVATAFVVLAAMWLPVWRKEEQCKTWKQLVTYISTALNHWSTITYTLSLSLFPKHTKTACNIHRHCFESLIFNHIHSLFSENIWKQLVTYIGTNLKLNHLSSITYTLSLFSQNIWKQLVTYIGTAF